jgi:hypothetical protein
VIKFQNLRYVLGVVDLRATAPCAGHSSGIERTPRAMGRGGDGECYQDASGL